MNLPAGILGGNKLAATVNEDKITANEIQRLALVVGRSYGKCRFTANRCSGLVN